MKAGTAASIIAYAYLHARREYPAGSLALTAVSDEETGGRWGSRWLLDNGEDNKWHGDCMLNAEPGGLETIRFGEKGTLRLTFKVRTPGAHGAYTHRSEGAIRVAVRLIQRLQAVEDIVPDLPPSLVAHLNRPEVREMADRVMGKGAADIIGVPTLNIGTIRGGLKVNMIPDSCIFEADIRLPIGLERDRVMETINNILKDFPEADVAPQEAACNPPNSCAHDHPMVEILARNAERVTRIKPVSIPSLGATDCKFWRYRNAPAYVYGPSPNGMAMVDESVSVDEFLAVVKTHALSAWDYLGGNE
jgi:succinyl-diaminopimelate desuccinylase